MSWSKSSVSPEGSNKPFSYRAAIAIPTALEIPEPSGPVVISTPAVWPYSGCPGVLEPAVRKLFRSDNSRP